MLIINGWFSVNASRKDIGTQGRRHWRHRRNTKKSFLWTPSEISCTNPASTSTRRDIVDASRLQRGNGAHRHHRQSFRHVPLFRPGQEGVQDVQRYMPQIWGAPLFHLLCILEPILWTNILYVNCQSTTRWVSVTRAKYSLNPEYVRMLECKDDTSIICSICV